MMPADCSTMERHRRKNYTAVVKWNEPWTVKDPYALTQSYLALFESLGGRFLKGDARSLAQTASGWRIVAGDGMIEAKDVVVALGPWSDTVTRSLGYRILVGVKLGRASFRESVGQNV